MPAQDSSQMTSAATLDIDLAKIRERLVESLYQENIEQPDQQLRTDFQHFIASLKIRDKMSAVIIRQTWFQDLKKSWAETLCGFVRKWLQSKHPELENFLRIYLPGLPKWAFNYTQGGNSCLFYSLLCCKVGGLKPDGSLLDYGLLSKVLNNTSNLALKSPTSSGDTVVKAFYRLCISPIVTTEERELAESQLDTLSLWADLLQKADPTDINALVRAEFRNLAPMVFARLFSPALCRLVDTPADYQRFLTKQAVVELALFPFDINAYPAPDDGWSAWHQNNPELLRMLCSATPQPDSCVTLEQAEKWLEDHQCLFSQIKKQSDDNALCSKSLRDVIWWLLSGVLKPEDVLDHLVIPGRFEFFAFEEDFIDSAEAPEELSEDAKKGYADNFARVHEHLMSKWPKFSSLFFSQLDCLGCDSYRPLNNLRRYWKTSDIDSVFKSLTTTKENSDQIRSKNLFDLATSCLLQFTHKHHERFHQKFNTSVALLALEHPLWSQQEHTRRLYEGLRNMPTATAIGSRQVANIVSALLDHPAYQDDLTHFTFSDVRRCIGFALKSIAKTDYRIIYSKNRDITASLDFCRKVLHIKTASHPDLWAGSANFRESIQFIRNNCAVCLVEMLPIDITEPFAVSQQIRSQALARAPCGHWFHQTCLLETALNYDKCPTCSASFFLS